MSVSRIWDLLIRKFNNEITPREMIELEYLLSEHKEVFEQDEAAMVLNNLKFRSVATAGDLQQSRAEIASRIGLGKTGELSYKVPLFTEKRQAVGRSNRGFILTLVAFLAVILAIGFLGPWFKRPIPLHDQPMLPYHEVSTAAGSQSTVNLPDGSIVVLNEGSKLQYNKNFGTKERKITLTGEALFTIKKKAGIPLTVRAGEINILVTGTIFNVKAYPKDSLVEATLLLGAMEVASVKEPQKRLLMKPNDKAFVGILPIAGPPLSGEIMHRSVFLITTIQPDKSGACTEISWIKKEEAPE